MSKLAEMGVDYDFPGVKVSREDRTISGSLALHRENREIWPNMFPIRENTEILQKYKEFYFVQVVHFLILKIGYCKICRRIFEIGTG